jgi:hypothetical protein
MIGNKGSVALIIVGLTMIAVGVICVCLGI